MQDSWENGKFIQTDCIDRILRQKDISAHKRMIVKLLELKGIDINKCVDFTTDGASNMRGCKNGLTVEMMSDFTTKRENSPFYITTNEYFL